MPRHLNTAEAASCATCEIEIAGPAVVDGGSAFCCGGCVAGGPCTCSYDAGPSDSRVRDCLDVRGAVAAHAPARFTGGVDPRRG